MIARRTVRPSVDTLTRLSTGELGGEKRAQRGRGPAKSSRVRLSRVNAKVMATALKLAGGDASRIELVSETEVLVH